MKTYKRIRIATLALAVSLLLSSLVPASAAGKLFTDVPDNHWAKESIDLIAEGGLMNGYGGGLFGPADTFNIDHLATVIANINGQPREAKNGYWAYSAVDYCVNTLKCLPSQGEICAANYSKPCTRELAVYMLVEGPGPVNATLLNVVTTDIPDYNAIDPMYRNAVMQAYKYGMTNGTDSNRTFAPKSLLNRAQAATMLVRCGYTKAADVATPQTGILSGQQAFEAIKNMPGDIWKVTEWIGDTYLTAKDPKYGAIKVTINQANVVTVSANEWNSSVWFNSSNQYVDVNGNTVASPYDSNGKMVVSTGFGYEARQLVKQIMDVMYTSDADLQTAYEVFQDVFAEKVYEYPSTTQPSAYRWVGGRYLSIALNSNYGYTVAFGEANNIDAYNRVISRQKENARKDHHIYYAGSHEAAVIAYELNRW